jgi:hypothetical protein
MAWQKLESVATVILYERGYKLSSAGINVLEKEFCESERRLAFLLVMFAQPYFVKLLI